MNIAPALPIAEEQQAQLVQIAKSPTAPYRQVVRARLLLDAASGMSNQALSERYGVTRVTARSWRKRFLERGLKDFGSVDPGRGRRPSIPQEIVEAIAAAAAKSPKGKSHYSTYDAAREFGVSPASVQRIWSGRGLKPHRTATFKVSNDPHFEEKLVDIVGLYMNPPDNAVVLSVDEKSQIQALDRTQASLPIKQGRCGTMTHDYKRNGTTTLFAALNVLSGTVLGSCSAHHRHQEFLAFLKLIDKDTPKELDIHVICDNYSTHKHENVKKWLERHKRFHIHFTPTSSSWLNLVERWFRDLTVQSLRRGVFTSVPDLVQTIEGYIEANNKSPKPFVWTASAQSIITKVKRARTRLDQMDTQK